MKKVRSLRSNLWISLLLSGATAHAVEPPKGQDYYDKQILPVLQDYCYDCHGDGMDKGDFALDEVLDFKQLITDKRMWDSVREHMESFVMPPEDKAQPTKEERDRVTHWIENDVFWVDPTKPDPGHITLRRLNRTEYNNTVREIFRTNLRPANSFPPDDTGYGFDNIGDVLSLSPLLMEKYMKAAKQVSQAAVWTGAPRRRLVETNLKNWKVSNQAGAIGGPHHTIWGTGTLSAPFRVTSENNYRLSLMLSSNVAGNEGAKYRVLANGKEVASGEVKAAYRADRPESNWEEIALDVRLKTGTQTIAVEFLNDFNDAKHPDPTRRDRNLLVKSLQLHGPIGRLRNEYSPFMTWLFDGSKIMDPKRGYHGADFDVISGRVVTHEGSAILATNGKIQRKVSFPEDGEYSVMLDVGQHKAGDEAAKYRVKLAGKDLGVFEAKTDTGKTQQMVVLKQAQKSGSQLLEVEFINDTMIDGKDRNLVVRSVLMERTEAKPFNYKDEAFIKHWVNRLGLKMFRRPLTPSDETKLINLVKLVYQSGDSFEESVKLVSEALLASSRFLFIGGAEPTGPIVNESALVDEFTLASRLSYFLWSCPPDDQLLELAKKGELRKNLRPQIQRMLQDKFRSRSLSDNFGGQWLQLRDMDLVEPNTRLFPEITQGLRDLYKRESLMYFNHVLSENRSVLEFLDSDYTFLNEKLASFYGIQGVKGGQFRQVSLKGTPRGGILTHGSILTITSHPTRTSPVKRGTFLLENILGTPPPPAPQNVPPLNEDRGAKISGTLRQRFEAHRANPSCAGCHAFLDPMGFAFENYNAIGLWRANDNGQAIDASGKLLTGETFLDGQELRKLLVKHRGKEFVSSIIRNLLTYSMGRGLDYSDRLFVKQIRELSEKDGYKFQDLIYHIIESTPFQKMRAGDSKETAEAATQFLCPDGEVATVK